MSSGAGRGRGWLNLGKNGEAPRPGGLSQLAKSEVSRGPPEHKELIERVKEISLNDDGIVFNKKMQYVQSYWIKECSSKEDVEASFEQLYTACLHDTELASKLVLLMASHTFLSLQQYDCNLRHLFLGFLQKDFENSNQLQTTNPLLFRNCVHMIGEFYSKARPVSSGEPYKFLAAPFLSCLELLLNSENIQDLMLFTNQLYLNGSSLKTTLPEELPKLGLKIRNILVTENKLTRESKVWLLLALDLFSARFGILPSEIYKYYESQLGSTAMINFQRPHDTLSIQTTHPSKVLDSYQSNVNVLQISTSPTDSSQSDYTYSEYNGTQKSKEKTGRPILGAGARFINKSKGEDSWNNKQNSSGRHSKKPPSLKSNKGWEHDDRFENDYN